MHKRRFDWTEVDVPVIGMGTWMIEGSNNLNARRQAVESLQLGLDLGMMHIDTAEMYGSGQAEELVAEAIAGRRDQLFLVSKVLPSNASYEGTLRACKQSLSRLRTDWLDLYLVHWPSDRHPIKETMRAMEKLVAEGMVRFIGVSNFDVQELKAAEDALKSETRLQPAALPSGLPRDRAAAVALLRKTRDCRGRLFALCPRRFSAAPQRRRESSGRGC